MFKVKINSIEKDNHLHYKVYAIAEKTIDPTYRNNKMLPITKFLIYDNNNGFHWIDASLCVPI